MRRILFCGLSGLALCALHATQAWAGPNAADYTLRVHIVQNSNHAHYRYRELDWVDGEGRATLFENSPPRGFDYGFRCGDRVQPSPGWETYPARWKKPDRELEILEPAMGKPGSWNTCTLKVEMKPMVYVRHNGLVDEEPADKFKQWMDRRQYDPEHGKNEPSPAPRAPYEPPAPPPATPTVPPGTPAPQ
jgi:hypothetical protein